VILAAPRFSSSLSRSHEKTTGESAYSTKGRASAHANSQKAIRAFLHTNRYPVRVEGCLRGWCRPAQAPQDGWHPQGAKTRYPVHWRRSSGRLPKHPFSFNTSQAQYEVVAPVRSFSVSLDRENSTRFVIMLLPEHPDPEAPQSTSGYSESVLPRDRSSWAGSGRSWSELSTGDRQWVLGKGFRQGAAART